MQAHTDLITARCCTCMRRRSGIHKQFEPGKNSVTSSPTVACSNVHSLKRLTSPPDATAPVATASRMARFMPLLVLHRQLWISLEPACTNRILQLSLEDLNIQEGYPDSFPCSYQAGTSGPPLNQQGQVHLEWTTTMLDACFHV